MNSKSLLVIIIAVVLMAFVASVSGEAVEKDKRMNLEAAGISSLDVECGAGSLRITGVSGLEQIEVTVNVQVKGIDENEIDDFIKNNVELSLSKEGSRAVLVSKVIKGVSSLFGTKSALLNLEVRVPQNINLDIDDGSGSIVIDGIKGNVDVEDGSGAMEITDVSGDVVIDDGSGIIVTSTIGGNLKVDDGSGAIRINGVKGDVDVEDNSGQLTIKDIGGFVVVDDGSGGILIDGVQKDVKIKRAGSGAVSIKNVKGKVIK